MISTWRLFRNKFLIEPKSTWSPLIFTPLPFNYLRTQDQLPFFLNPWSSSLRDRHCGLKLSSTFLFVEVPYCTTGLWTTHCLCIFLRLLPSVLSVMGSWIVGFTIHTMGSWIQRRRWWCIYVFFCLPFSSLTKLNTSSASQTLSELNWSLSDKVRPYLSSMSFVKFKDRILVRSYLPSSKPILDNVFISKVLSLHLYDENGKWEKVSVTKRWNRHINLMDPSKLFMTTDQIGVSNN